MFQCDVQDPEPCTNQAAYQATKPCGHKSNICLAHKIASADNIIACPEHKIYWPGDIAYQTVEVL